MYTKRLLLLLGFIVIGGLMMLAARPLAAQDDGRVPDGPTLNCFPGRAPRAGTLLHVQGTAWHDNMPHNGINDVAAGTENALDSVVVDLTCKNDTTGDSDTWSTGTGDLGITGWYSFTIIMDAIPDPDWEFELAFSPPAGYLPTWSNAGLDDTVDSDQDGSGSIVFQTTTASTTLVYDAGFTQAAANGVLTGTVWKEAKLNNLFDAGERTISNVLLSFECPELIDDGLSATTDFDGNYTFNLWYDVTDPALLYDCGLMVTPPSGLSLVVADDGDETIDSDFNAITGDVTITIDSTLSVADNDAGFADSVPASVVSIGQVSAETDHPLYPYVLLLALVTVLVFAGRLRRR